MKIRGFRVEPEEIEAVLAGHPRVREAAVAVRDDLGAGLADRRLVAYVVGDRAEAVTAAELKGYLGERLPEYMVPSAVVFLEAMPLTPGGKLDRRALPRPERPDEPAEGELAAPRGEIEETLARVWEQLLGVGRVGRGDNFFALGGHSLLATQVLSRVREIFRLELPLRRLFEAPTLSALAVVVFEARRSVEGGEVPPLVPVPRGGPLPLSFAQERLWFLDQLQPGAATYNMPAAVLLGGPLRTAALERAFTEIVRRHESLRTRFAKAAGETGGGVQTIDPPAPFPLSQADLSGLQSGLRDSEAARLTIAESSRPFDLARGPLFRAGLLRLAPDLHRLLLTMHHIVSDGWSMGVLIGELGSAYRAFAAGTEPSLPSLPVRYADFATWQRAWLTGGVLAAQLDYWRRTLGGDRRELPWVELPADRPRPPFETVRGARTPFAIPAAITGALDRLGRRLEATSFMILLAAFDTLLAGLTGLDDVPVGTPIAGRTRGEIEGLIGFFINTLVLRGDLSGDPSFAALLARIRATALDAYSHQDVPFEQLVAELKPRRSLAQTPLFQVLFVLQNAPGGALEAGDLTLTTVDSYNGTARFDLTLSLWPSGIGGGLQGFFEAKSDLFDAATVKRWVRSFQTLLEAAVEDPERRLSALPLLASAERHQLVAEWNDTAAPYAGEPTLHELIAAQVDRTPHAVAVVFADTSLTYEELDRRASILAVGLRRLGAGPESLVGLGAERSLEMMVGLYAILKAGAAYVPLDPGYPSERLAYMIGDSGVRVLLIQSHLAGALEASGAHVLLLDQEGKGEAEEALVFEPPAVDPDNLAYVIYTSGSTGRPKGAMNTHRAIRNRLLWMQAEYVLTADDRVLQKTPVSFDVSVWELFWPLLVGARLVVARPGGHQDPAYLVDVIASQGITTLHFVPSMLRVFVETPGLERCRGLRRVIASGEALPLELTERFAARVGAPLENLYGPTEAAVDVTSWTCEPGGTRGVVPIGRPIGNLEIHLLDRLLRPVPIGVAGELLIGGTGLARGYLGRPELTAERFVPHPLAAEPGARLYRTGDLARRLPDGVVDFLGRLDHQIKIRGFRVEPGEIEAILAQHSGVREVVVLARRDDAAQTGGGEIRLVAYVVPEEDLGLGDTADAVSLRAHLLESVPEHMVPAHFVLLDALPVTPNGKIDRQALPAPDGSQLSTQEYVAPRDGTETALAELWQRLLALPRVGILDNFFELGGHSLLATRVIAGIRESFGVELPLRALFEKPTVAGLALAVAQERVEKAGDPDVARMIDDLANLSDEEIEAMLAAEEGE